MSSSTLLGAPRRTLIAAASLATFGYLVWRLLTLSFDAPVPVFFVGLELHAGLSFFLFAFSVWDTEASTWPGLRRSSPHRVAVCITTYNEDEHVLLPTVAAAVALEPRHETWVLDDGDRPWVRAMAEQVGAHYLTRPDRSHAKAGNLNHAFGLIDADLLAMLDADHIPTRHFLTHTLGYFDDPAVALVQTPQDFYNTESFEHVGDYAEEALFYRVIQPGKNRWQSAFWCGTSAVVRAEALRSVGGVATESVTEDLLTTIKLHERGWRTVFHDEVLARGLAPASYKEFLVQRMRWATGAMQILRSRHNPWLARRLTLAQRLSFTASLTGWFEGLRSIGYLLLASAVVLTGATPVGVPLGWFLVANLGVLVLTATAQVRAGQGRHQLLPALLFEFLRIPVSVHALGRLLVGGRARFQVTPKGRAGDERRTPPVPGVLIGLASIAAAGVVVYLSGLLGLTAAPRGRQVDVAALVLVGHLIVIGAAARRIRRQDFGDERRRARRFRRDLRFVVGSTEGRLLHPSTTGAHIAGRIRTGRHQLSLFTKEGPVDFRCWVTPDHDGESTVEFVPGQYRQQAVLARSLYGEVQDMPILHHQGVPDPYHQRRAVAPARRDDDPPPTAVPTIVAEAEDVNARAE